MALLETEELFLIALIPQDSGKVVVPAETHSPMRPHLINNIATLTVKSALWFSNMVTKLLIWVGNFWVIKQPVTPSKSIALSVVRDW